MLFFDNPPEASLLPLRFNTRNEITETGIPPDDKNRVNTESVLDYFFVLGCYGFEKFQNKFNYYKFHNLTLMASCTRRPG